MKRICLLADHTGGANALANPLLRLMADGIEVEVVSGVYADPVFAAAKIPFKKIEDFGLSDISAASMEKLLNQVKPDLVIAAVGGQGGEANDVMGQTSVLAARNFGITSMSVLDIPAGYSSRWSDERTGNHLDCLPDVVATLDERAKQEMVAEGFPANQLEITGNPYFDDFFARGQRFSQEQRGKYGKKSVCLAKHFFWRRWMLFPHSRKNTALRMPMCSNCSSKPCLVCLMWALW